MENRSTGSEAACEPKADPKLAAPSIMEVSLMVPQASAIQFTERERIVRASFLGLILFSLGHFFIDLYSAALGTFQPLLGVKLNLSLTRAGILGGLLVFSASVMQPVY